MPKNGFTLLELTIVMIVVSIIFSVGSMFSDNIFTHHHQKKFQQELIQAIRFSRLEAMQLHKPVTMRPINNDWCHGIQIMAGNDEIRVVPGLNASCHIDWKSFPSQPYLRFTPEGSTEYQNGRFVSDDEHHVVLWQVIISQSGRVR